MSTNDITGDKIQTKSPTKAYLNNYDAIFRKQDERETCPYCGIKTDDPCDSLPADICEQAINRVFGDPTK